MSTTRRAGKSPNPSSPSPSPATATMRTSTPRASPFLPTPVERLALGLFPLILVFGSLFALLSPHTRSLTYDADAQTHASPADGSGPPSYFARKSNVFNVYFVKLGWGWTTAALFAFILTHPSVSSSSSSSSPSSPSSSSPATTKTTRAAAGVAARWAALTAFWILVVRWCFGAPLIDRGFRWTGGKCEVAELGVAAGTADMSAALTAAACRAASGRWRGGHDISGHVFLLTMGSAMLMHEVLWPLARWAAWWPEERCVVMADGALKGAGVEAETAAGAGRGEEVVLGYGGRFALGVLGLNLWMLLMTATYFHTWFEKLAGLLVAFVAIYAVYYVPRFVPLIRRVIGVPGI